MNKNILTYLFFSSCCVGSLGYLEAGGCYTYDKPYTRLATCALYSGVNCSSDTDMQGMINNQNNIVTEQQAILAGKYGTLSAISIQNAKTRLANAQTNINNITTCRGYLQTQIASYKPTACDDDAFHTFSATFTPSVSPFTTNLQNARTTWSTNMCGKITSWNTSCSSKITPSQLSDDITLVNGVPLNSKSCIDLVTSASGFNKSFLQQLSTLKTQADAFKPLIDKINSCKGTTGASAGWAAAATTVNNTVQPGIDTVNKWAGQNMGLATPFYGGTNTYCSIITL